MDDGWFSTPSKCSAHLFTILFLSVISFVPSMLSMGELPEVSGPYNYGLDRVEEALHIVSVGIALDLVDLVAEPGILHDVQLSLHFSTLADVSIFL